MRATVLKIDPVLYEGRDWSTATMYVTIKWPLHKDHIFVNIRLRIRDIMRLDRVGLQQNTFFRRKARRLFFGLQRNSTRYCSVQLDQYRIDVCVGSSRKTRENFQKQQLHQWNERCIGEPS